MPLIIESSKNTPKVVFNEGTNDFRIQGKCFPENSRKFFQPMMDWLNEFTPETDLTIHINIDYLSSSSNITLLKVINELSRKSNYNVTVNWMYEDGDDETLKSGELLQEATEAQFTFQCLAEDV